MKNKIVSAAEAIAIIRAGDTVSIAGFVGIGTPDELLDRAGAAVSRDRQPRDLTLMFAAAPGDGKERGLNRLAHPGLVRRAVGGHWALVPKLGKLAIDNQIEAYNLPLGCIAQLYRDIAARRAGLRSPGSACAPSSIRGWRAASSTTRTTEDLVELLQIGGEECLLYKAFPINVALIRGTTADTAGNITMEREALTLDELAAAMAAKNSGGFVIAQVERIAAGRLAQSRARCRSRACWWIAWCWPSRRTTGRPMAPATTARSPAPARADGPDRRRCALDERKVIARRCARTAAGRRRQSRHRHAGRRRGGRGRGEGAAISSR